VAALAAASAMIRSPALSQVTTDSGLVHSGAEYSGCAWSTVEPRPVGQDDVGQSQVLIGELGGVRRLPCEVKPASVPPAGSLPRSPTGRGAPVRPWPPGRH